MLETPETFSAAQSKKQSAPPGTTNSNKPQNTPRTLANQAARQVDFYFSDKNYGRDAYLTKVAARDADRFIALSEILSFNKMRVLMRGLETNELVEALQRHQKNFKNCSFELSDDS